MAGDIILLSWVVFLVYWLFASRNVKEDEEVVFSPNNLRYMVIALVILLIYLKDTGRIQNLPFISCRPDQHGCFAQLLGFHPINNFPVQLVSVLLVVLGLGVAIIARRTLAGNWSGQVTLKKGHTLVTTGIYAYMRHPIYTGITLMGIGFVLYSGSVTAVCMFIILFVFIMFKLKKEEELLTKHFGKKYVEYKNHTKALIPYIL